MNYPKNFDPYVDKNVVAASIGRSVHTAKKIIQDINDKLESEGWIVERGLIPASELPKVRKVKMSTIVYHYENLGYGYSDKEKGTSDN